MINYIKGDLFTTPDKYILHGCNNAGVMGSGVAKAIKEKYPKAYEDYVKACNAAKFPNHDTMEMETIALGTVIASPQPDGKIIFNAITQGAYGFDGKKYVSYDAVDMIMNKIANGAPSGPISMPKIGAGLGGGDWKVIEAIIAHRLVGHVVNIYEL